ncbi:hypothetical protein K491DRAFT_717537 [Lophiostoma macrostomum CBS 122681]|uniref:F-box domain-containing protein n=1 Tax=Lophiostoma macrostomum CBS 122681 TaxID=1314788 RepID=A0A6A6T2M1_9PLEO|nr:hypothetical protein K491DRAFT_717537 [Lophiostoma macrostomum CBS 122681]
MPDPKSARPVHVNLQNRVPITSPHHSWFTSPARSHTNIAKGKELPLNLIALILSHLDDVGDLARLTRTSRLLYYMTLPRLYEEVTLRSYADIRYVDGWPAGYGSASPFAMGLNTLVSRTVTDYVRKFRVVGDWKEHDVEDYAKGRVPDNSMMLQIAMRAAMDKMKNLEAFAWELSTKPLATLYQALMAKPSITSFTLRCQTKRITRPTTVIPPLPNLVTLVVYDIDPLCSPDDISLVLVHAKKLENLKMHWNPRMRETGEGSVNLLDYFGRCVAARHMIPIRRMALYNLYARNSGDGFDHCTDPATTEEITVINCMGSSDPTTVFLDETWRVNSKHPVPRNLKMMRGDLADKGLVDMLLKIRNIERMYLVNRPKGSKSNSSAATPTSPSTVTPTPNGSAANTPVTPQQCKGVAGDFLAAIQTNHPTLRHLLLADIWQLSEDALFQLCRSCPNLEQLGFAASFPALDVLRKILALVPKLRVLRLLVRPESELAEKLASMDPEMHQFALATELWRPQYKNLRYISLGEDLHYRLGEVLRPAKRVNGSGGGENSFNALSMGMMRRVIPVPRSEVQHIEIWGMDTMEFDPKFP